MNDQSNDWPQSDSEIDLQLTAYLDGELEELDIQQVEQRLASDTQYLKRMQALQKTWDMIDVLPRPIVAESFTKSTLELVMDKATRDEQKRRRRTWTWPFQFAALVGIPALAFGATYALAHFYQRQPVEQLADDLPLIENLQYYEKIDSIEFLSQLEKQGVFADQEDLYEVPGNE